MHVQNIDVGELVSGAKFIPNDSRGILHYSELYLINHPSLDKYFSDLLLIVTKNLRQINSDSDGDISSKISL